MPAVCRFVSEIQSLCNQYINSDATESDWSLKDNQGMSARHPGRRSPPPPQFQRKSLLQRGKAARLKQCARTSVSTARPATKGRQRARVRFGPGMRTIDKWSGLCPPHRCPCASGRLRPGKCHRCTIPLKKMPITWISGRPSLLSSCKRLQSRNFFNDWYALLHPARPRKSANERFTPIMAVSSI